MLSKATEPTASMVIGNSAFSFSFWRFSSWLLAFKLLCHSDRSRMIRNANRSAEWRKLSARSGQTLLFPWTKKQVSRLRRIVRFAANPASLEMTVISGMSQYYAKLNKSYSRYFPKISFSLSFAAGGILARSVRIACASADPHLHDRSFGIAATASRTTLQAFSAFFSSTATI